MYVVSLEPETQTRTSMYPATLAGTRESSGHSMSSCQQGSPTLVLVTTYVSDRFKFSKRP